MYKKHVQTVWIFFCLRPPVLLFMGQNIPSLLHTMHGNAVKEEMRQINEISSYWKLGEHMDGIIAMWQDRDELVSVMQ